MKLTFNTAFLPIPSTSFYYPKDERAGFHTPTLFSCCEMSFSALGNQEVTHAEGGLPGQRGCARTPELCSHLSRLIPAIFHSVLLALLVLCSRHKRHTASLPPFPRVKCYLQCKVHSLQLIPRPQQDFVWRSSFLQWHILFMYTKNEDSAWSPTWVTYLHINRLMLASYCENWYEIGSAERDIDAHSARPRRERKIPVFPVFY